MIVASFLILGIITLELFKVKLREWNLVFSGAGLGISIILMLERFPI